MPIREFQCVGCGHEFEEIVVSQNAVIHCPQCSGADIKKLISSFSFKSAGNSTKSSSSSNCSSCSAKSCSSCS